MTSWFARGAAACTLGLVLFACSDDDGQRSPAPSTPTTSARAPAAPTASSTSAPAPAATGGDSTPTNGASSAPSGAATSACAPNAACGGISNCQDTHYTCASGQIGQMYCDCDGSATDPSAHLSCVIYC